MRGQEVLTMARVTRDKLRTRSYFVLVVIGMTAMATNVIVGMYNSFLAAGLDRSPAVSAIDHEPLKLPPGVEVDVASLPEPGALFTRGFAQAEGDGAWLSSLSGELQFRSQSGQTIRRVSLGVLPYTPGSVEHRRVTLAAGDRESSFDLQEGGAVVWLEGFGGPRGTLTVTCDSVDSPRDLGLSDDVRPLCLFLLWIRIDI